MTAPARIGRYEIVRRLGRSMTDVYLAVDTVANRKVALKLIRCGGNAISQLVLEAERRGAAIQQQLRALDPRPNDPLVRPDKPPGPRPTEPPVTSHRTTCKTHMFRDDSTSPQAAMLGYIRPVRVTRMPSRVRAQSACRRFRSRSSPP